MLDWLINTFGQSITLDAAKAAIPDLLKNGWLKPGEENDWLGCVAFLEKMGARAAEGPAAS